jgi:hypothetical protein
VSNFASQHIHILMQDLGYARNASQWVTLPEEATRWEVNRANNERLQAWRQMRQAWSAAQAAVRAQGEETPSKPESLGGGNEEDEDEEDGEFLPFPTLHPLKTSPRSVTSSASKRGSMLLHAS